MFNKKMDWSHELLRCGASGWRVLSREREDNIPERTLPMHYVIPKTVTEIEYIKLAESFNRSRAAIWVCLSILSMAYRIIEKRLKFPFFTGL